MTDQIFYEELRATIRDAIASYLDTYTDEELRELATESLNTPALPGGWRLADHKDHGRVIVTTTTPNSGGHVYFTVPTDGNMGYGCHFCDPAELTFLTQGADTSDTVPEGTLTVGSVWDDADALTRACAGFWRDQIVVADKRGMVGVWDTGMQCWRVSAPHADFAPYTVIYVGKKADQ